MRLPHLLIGLCCVAFAWPALAQSRYQELLVRHTQARTYHEAFAVPGKPSVVVAFRIPNSQLVFVRNREEAPGRLFIANAEVTVQLYRGGQKVDEAVWRREHFAATFEDTQSKTLDLSGMVGFDVPPGHYGYRLILKDEQVDQTRQSWLEPLVVPDFGAAVVGTEIAARHVVQGVAGPSASLVALGGDLPYGEAAVLLVPVGLPAGTDPGAARLQYTLFRQDPEQVREEERARQAARDRQRRAPSEPLVLPGEAAAVRTEGEPVASGVVEGAAFLPVGSLDKAALAEGRLQWQAAGVPEGYLAPIDAGSARLPDGAYVLEVRLDAGGASIRQVLRFRTHWRNMPASLYSPEVAIRNLSFIEDRKTIRAMLRGSYAEQEARIRAYWQERDPSPGTAYNELMAEYYRRIDHAAIAFQTGRFPYPDGLETDRARIYVVHGPADQVERIFPPGGGVEEVWRYAGGRQFVFWAPSSLDAFVLKSEGPR